MVTFLLVIFRDLTEGILVGFALSTLLFLHRMSQSVAVEHTGLAIDEDKADSVNGNGRKPYDVGQATDPDVTVVRGTGAFFFGAAAAVRSEERRGGKECVSTGRSRGAPMT